MNNTKKTNKTGRKSREPIENMPTKQAVMRIFWRRKFKETGITLGIALWIFGICPLLGIPTSHIMLDDLITRGSYLGLLVLGLLDTIVLSLVGILVYLIIDSNLKAAKAQAWRNINPEMYPLAGEYISEQGISHYNVPEEPQAEEKK
jgi:hypothetical protein